MDKIVVLNQKGGVGKSTSVVNIAGCMSSLYRKVLVVDIDPQCTTTSYLRTMEGDSENTLYDYIYGNKEINDVIYEVSFSKWNPQQQDYVFYKSNISLISSDSRFSNTKLDIDIDLFNTIFSEISEERFDYCIFDCPGYISTLTESALRASEFIIIPAFADIDSLRGYSDLIETKNRIRQESNNINLDILGIFFTSITTMSINKQMMAFCTENFGSDLIFQSTIRRAASILDARVIGKPIINYKPTEPVAQDYMLLTKEIIYKIDEKMNRREE